MATILRTQFTRMNDDIAVHNWYNFFNESGCNYISAEILQNPQRLIITVFDKVTFTMGFTDSGGLIRRPGVSVAAEGTSVWLPTNENHLNPDPAYVIVAYDNAAPFCYIQINGYGDGAYVGIGTFVQEIDNKILYGMFNTPLTSITNLGLKEYGESGIGGYTHKNILNYDETALSKIDYTSDYIFVDGHRYIQDPTFISCTYIPYDTIITFGGKNYYAIGTNTLIEIEED